ncbi:50S ribosomal protein L22 [Candidatus Acidianus copahuensis]|uniref:Large ribosomal subunit protein uL22 n=1 Tax=Candidatus Acidianus copahuensis TaxID=1160895 RepID=A0A031LKJ5_9CREN|nr:50S ribosomal protein L22 [Candidatus Acidianus copahuensis]EZQ03858.1 50S ribosomal protein L22 [Candidatus Acidianus copahuensis]
MGSWKYPLLGVDEEKVYKAVLKEVPASYRDLYNVCKAVRGMNLQSAKKFLERVERKEEALPFYRYSHGSSHRSNISSKWKVKNGRYPVKAVQYVLKVLNSAESNAVAKGLDADSLTILHIACHKGITLKRFMPRAFGRATAKYRRTSNIEVMVGEV